MDITPILSQAAFSSAILTWFDANGRKHLPWQQQVTPYKVWVSEIMLQQTQVATVIPYFKRFMQRFPDIATLAAASEDIVMQHWAGLGYYARARNLQRSAQHIMQQHQGEFPTTLADLVQLPGIGPSTAGAILALSMQQRGVILDGNVKRVLARSHTVSGAINSGATQKKLWQLADYFTPDKRVAAYTQAMMDLGATLCTAKNPNCSACPLQTDCRALCTKTTTDYPQRKKKSRLPIRTSYFLLLQFDDALLFEKRPPHGIWGGLWCTPTLDSLDKIEQHCRERFAVTILLNRALTPFRHTFSHFHLEIQPQWLQVQPLQQQLQSASLVWKSLDQCDTIGLPKPVTRLIRQLEQQYEQINLL